MRWWGFSLGFRAAHHGDHGMKNRTSRPSFINTPPSHLFFLLPLSSSTHIHNIHLCIGFLHSRVPCFHTRFQTIFSRDIRYSSSYHRLSSPISHFRQPISTKSTLNMPSMKNIILLAFATLAAAQVSQITDGQVQAPTSTAKAVVSQITDGQIQAPTSTPKAVVTQITDGQVQAPTKATVAPVSQITDGQVQAPTKATVAPVSQITDGQVQAPTKATVAPVSQITDGQVQAPTKATVAPVSQITDGQIQAPTSAKPIATVNATFSTSAPLTIQTAGASIFGWSMEIGLAAVGLAAAALL